MSLVDDGDGDSQVVPRTEQSPPGRSVVGRPSLRAGVGLVDFLCPGRLAECLRVV
jgi:hypothetical protein